LSLKEEVMLLIIYLTMLVTLLAVTPAHSYIDPNTGGFFFQTVAPFVYGILGAIVIFWKRLYGFIRKLLGHGKGKTGSVDNE